MPGFSTYFTQFCPVCGRPVRIPVTLLGQSVACGHCHASFTAQADADRADADRADSTNDGTGHLVLRATALLAMVQHAES